MIRSKLCVLRRMLWTALSVTTVVFITVFGSLSPVSAAKKIAGRSFEIPAWTFDRGNANVDPNPFMYADYRDNYPELVITDGECSPWVVEYDIDFPVDASYTLNIRYASDLPRPLQLWLDDRLRWRRLLRLYR